jgi:23S rRNA (guanosine2251-2'-O)-methyltransferase
MASYFQIRQCTNLACGLRYPMIEGHPYGERCPLCLSDTKIALKRKLETEPLSLETPELKPQMETMLDNVRSAWNVGSIFRTADGYGLDHIHLCGITPTPDNPAVGKTALSAEKTIPWTYYKNSMLAGEKLKAEGYILWALEHDPRAVSIYDLKHPEAEPEFIKGRKLILIVGNEVTGIDPGLLDLCDKIIYLPMRGSKRSFNVSVAFGIATQFLRYKFVQES